MLRSRAPPVMENRVLLQRRLGNQRLVGTSFRTAADVVSWLGAVQSQDYAAATWGLSLRAKGLSRAAIDDAFDAGEILRTHILRPTWHFVHRDDLSWLIALSGPRVDACCRSYYRAVELDARTFRRSHSVLERALAGGRHLTRPELAAVLSRSRIATSGLRLAFLVMEAELAGVICSGPRRGNQFTYALLRERAAPARGFVRDEALAELARRYFTSHGPATVRDFCWWSGLTQKDAKAGLAMNASTLVQEIVEGLTCWHDGRRLGRTARSPFVRLLANYDEYFIAFKDRGWFDGPRPSTSSARDQSIFAHQLVIDGQLWGAWSRALRGNGVHVNVRPFRTLTRTERLALEAEVERYGAFLQLEPTLSIA
jgi:hypothetical protein